MKAKKEGLRIKLGHALFKARKKLGFRTQAEFAEKVGVGIVSVRLREQGHRLPSLETLAQMAIDLNVEMADLLPSLKELKAKAVRVDKRRLTSAA